MLRKSIMAFVYSVIITTVYFVTANIMYYMFNRQNMFYDPYFYEWVEYVVVAVVMFICVFLLEVVRMTFLARKSRMKS